MASQTTVCPHCSSVNPAPSRYCDQCGTELHPPPEAAQVDPPAVQELPRAPGGWTIGRASDLGLVRKQNEDALQTLTIHTNPNDPEYSLGLLLVADGMGGAAAGEVASRMAIDGVTQELSSYLGTAASAATKPDLEVLFKNAVAYANHEIYTARVSAGNDMGTTLVGAMLTGRRAIVINIGDSRAYVITQSEIRRVTKDHSLVQGLVDSGQITPDEMRTHPQRNLILRSLGGQSEVSPDTFKIDLAADSWLLICSDGLWEMVADSDIWRVVIASPSPQEACDALIRAAKENGGHDNVTVVIGHFTGDGEA